MKKLIIKVMTIVLIINTGFIQHVYAADNLVQPAAYFKSGVCGLTVEDAHISLYQLKMKMGRQVKINVFSQCGVPQQSVSFVVEIWKRGMLGDHKIRTFRKTLSNPANPRRIEYLGAKVKCKNLLPTIYYGKGQATALIQGKKYVSPWVVSEHFNVVDCGT